jgi:hypothetical protein
VILNVIYHRQNHLETKLLCEKQVKSNNLVGMATVGNDSLVDDDDDDDDDDSRSGS